MSDEPVERLAPAVVNARLLVFLLRASLNDAVHVLAEWGMKHAPGFKAANNVSAS